MTRVIDASVVVSWFIRDAFQERALRLLAKNQPFIAPELLLSEVANALWKTLRSATDPEAAKGISRFLRTVSRRVRLIPSRELVINAFSIARALDHPVYDCFYLAAAAQKKMKLVTFDERFARKVNASAFARTIELPPYLPRRARCAALKRRLRRGPRWRAAALKLRVR